MSELFYIILVSGVLFFVIGTIALLQGLYLMRKEEIDKDIFKRSYLGPSLISLILSFIIGVSLIVIYKEYEKERLLDDLELANFESRWLK